MKRLLTVLLLVCVFTASAGCGNIFVRATLNGDVLRVSGFVSLVQFTTVIDHGTRVTVTIVTFLQPGTSSSVTFCGDQRGQFPLDQFVQARFTQGPVCANVLVIVVG